MAAVTPIIPLAQIASAYGGSAMKPAALASEDFSSMVGGAAESALQTLRQSEQTTARGVAGKADVQDVVQALSNAEMTMQTVVAVRDKVLTAYNDVLHMTV
jgi:flagellar hook-basal body complex protein FliE